MRLSDFPLAASPQPGRPTTVPALVWGQARFGPAVRLAAVGDVGLSGRITPRQATRRSSPFACEVSAVVASADLAFGNLECALTPGPWDRPFTAPPRAIHALADAHFTHLHLANNHILDAGTAGLAFTLDTLGRSGLVGLGAASGSSDPLELVRSDRHGVRIGWLACGRTGIEQLRGVPTFCELNEAELLPRVAEHKRHVDVLIVSLHIGYMFVDYPHPDHRALAHRLADAGASLVLMHHPHVLQGVEQTARGATICYSLGNFLFDWEEGMQIESPRIKEQRQGAIFLFDLDREGVASLAILPTLVDDDLVVRLARDQNARDILERVARLSADLERPYESTFRRQRAALNTGLALSELWRLLRHGRFRELLHKLSRLRVEHWGMLARWLAGCGFSPVNPTPRRAAERVAR